jgi:UDP-N-acetylmuramoylalanine--D-glutamate ligase
MTLNGQRILVAGLGASGEAATRLALGEGATVVVVDEAVSASLEERADALRAQGAEVRLGCTAWPGGRFHRMIVSPGIPWDSPWLEEARARGLPFESELELGWSRRTGRVVAVTGSNGKSTAVRLLADCLRAGGLTAEVAGNIGTPVCEGVASGRKLDWLVLEVSSFQLETCFALQPDLAILLNVQPNHLDRHPSFEAYRDLKLRLFARQSVADWAILPADLVETMRAVCPAARGRILTFGGPEDSVAAIRYTPGRVSGVGPRPVSLLDTAFDNGVLGPAVAALVAAANACGVGPDAVESALRSYRPLPHRMESVGECGGVRFIDNSKATTLAAMMASVVMTRGPVRLIAGGLPKETDWSAARALLASSVSGVYLIGLAAESMAAAWSDRVPCVQCGTLDQAVIRAAGEAVAGETVLLAPACASFDQFRSYSERGECFAKASAEWCSRHGGGAGGRE